MHSNSVGTTGFLGKINFLGDFDKTAVLSLRYAVAISSRWSISRKDELDWGAADVLCSNILEKVMSHFNS